MRRYLEVFFRYWILLLLPAVLLPIGEYKRLHGTPSVGSATVDVYVTQPLIAATGYTSFSTPAQTEADSLNQWLQSPAFCLDVARGSTAYASQLKHVPDPKGTAYADISKNVSVTVLGANLISINYAHVDSVIAEQIVTSVMNSLNLSAVTAAQRTSQESRQYFQEVLDQTVARYETDVQKRADYMRVHGISTSDVPAQLTADPTFGTLDQQVKDDQQTILDLRQKVQALNDAIRTASGNSVMQPNSYVLDTPRYTLPGGLKKLLTPIAIALVLGLLVSGGFMVLLVGLDHSISEPAEVTSLLELPVLATVPFSRKLARRKPVSAPMPGTNSVPAAPMPGTSSVAAAGGARE